MYLIGKSIPRKEGRKKVIGQALCDDDIYISASYQPAADMV